MDWWSSQMEEILYSVNWIHMLTLVAAVLTACWLSLKAVWLWSPLTMMNTNWCRSRSPHLQPSGRIQWTDNCISLSYMRLCTLGTILNRPSSTQTSCICMTYSLRMHLDNLTPSHHIWFKYWRAVSPYHSTWMAWFLLSHHLNRLGRNITLYLTSSWLWMWSGILILLSMQKGRRSV